MSASDEQHWRKQYVLHDESHDVYYWDEDDPHGITGDYTQRADIEIIRSRDTSISEHGTYEDVARAAGGFERRASGTADGTTTTAGSTGSVLYYRQEVDSAVHGAPGASPSYNLQVNDDNQFWFETAENKFHLQYGPDRETRTISNSSRDGEVSRYTTHYVFDIGNPQYDQLADYRQTYRELRIVPAEGRPQGVIGGHLSGYRDNIAFFVPHNLQQYELPPVPEEEPFSLPYPEAFDPFVDPPLREIKPYTTAGSPPDGIVAGFISGLGTSAKVGSNALTDTVVGFVGVGGLLFDNNPLHIDPTQQDIANGYNGSYLGARVGTEFVTGVLTGGLASLLGRGGQAAKLAGYGVVGLDAAGNGVTAGRGAADAYRRGDVTLGNATQMIGGAFGLAGNALGALGKSVDDLGDGSKALDDLVEFGGTKTGAVADDVYDPTSGRLTVLQDYCFAPETLIATASGPRPIGEIRKGDVVLAHDFHTGEWSEQGVAVFHESIYEGPLVTITTDGGPIRATVYHPFWVLSGRDLHERSVPRELAEDEDQGLSLPGRWVNSHELRCGDVLIDRNGRQRVVLKIEQEFVSGFLVHNLTIDEDHTFAVGPDALLVHNTAKCDVHGNSLKSTRPATLYRLEDKQGNLLKHGVTQDINKRYPKKYLEDKNLLPEEIGKRADMLQKERERVMRNPGPLNFEPWAGLLQ